MNHGEEAAYWYLRLNGFFPITDFVMHGRDGRGRTTDCDVLAVRPPHVTEPIGGQVGDRCSYLAGQLDFSQEIGIICQVKSGTAPSDFRFRSEHVSLCVRRLGLVPADAINDAVRCLASKSTWSSHGVTLAALLISKDAVKGPFLNQTLDQAEAFLRLRIDRYPAEKYKDRLFFENGLFQSLIELQARPRV